MKLKHITISGLVVAAHIAVMYMTQSFAFGAIQIRLATALYSMAALFPFLCIPMGLSNVLCNLLMGGLGLVDVVGGFIIGSVTTAVIVLMKKKNLNDWWLMLPVIFIPGLGVPIYLCALLGIPYLPLAISLCAGQVIPAIVGVFLVKKLRPALKNYME